jgi:uncharacterized protein (TIGR00251 family)
VTARLPGETPDEPFVDTEGGILIYLHAQPGAKRDAILGLQSGRLKVAVVQPPHDGRANQAIVALLAKQLKVAKSNCAIRRGQNSRLKLVYVAGLTRSEALLRIGPI